MEVKAIDTLTLLSGKQVQITDKIIYSQPKLLDVIRFGEQEYYQILSNMTAIPSDMKSVLWDAGIDWMEFSDMELFYVMTHTMPVEKSSIFFPGIDFSTFTLLKNQNDDLVMYSQEQEIIIDPFVFAKMQSCLCKSHGIKKKIERAGNKYTKQVLIEEDRQKRELNKDKPFKSNLFGLVSAMVNYAGFKYNYETVWNLTMFQFMDAVGRARLIDSTNHLLNGVYAGTIDGKKIKSDKFNWMREVHDE
jgi:hypothetical protein